MHHNGPLKKASNGIVHRAFYVQNTHGDTKSTFLGRGKSSNMEPFLYGKTKDGKVYIKGVKQ